MSTLGSFFHGADTHFGTFYPTHYLPAIYPGFEEAAVARNRSVDAGLSRDDAVAVPGEDLVHLCAEHLMHDGLKVVVMRKLSRLFGTEAVYLDHDLQLAERGAGFLAVHCRDEWAKDRAWRRLESTHPWAVRYYTLGGIEHLAGKT